MSSLRIGCIGGGSIAEAHAETLQSLGEDVVAVADVDPDARAAFAEQFDVPHAYETHEAMLDDADLDLAVVAVPNAVHEACAVDAIEAGLDVFVEKPVAHSLPAAERIAEAARKGDGNVSVGFVRAFEPWVHNARAEVADGTYGEVYDLEAQYVRQRGIPQLGSWFTRKDVSGGGAVIDVGVHVIHLALSVLDFPAIETVSASTGGYFGNKDDYTYLHMWGGDPVEGGTFDVDDYARALVRTADGTTLHFHFAWASNGPARRTITVYGDEAGLAVEDKGGSRDIRQYSADGNALTETALEYPDDHRLNAQWKYVTAVARGEREHTKNTVEEGLAVQRVVEAIYESAEKRREVVVE